MFGKQEDQAIADLTRAIALKPDKITAYTIRGDLYAEKGDDDRALADYRLGTAIAAEGIRESNEREDNFRVPMPSSQ